MNEKFTMSINENTMSCLLYVLSCFWIFPGSNFLLPLIVWVVGKEKSEVINNHGKNLLNFQISWLLGGIILWLLFCFISLPRNIFLGLFGAVYLPALLYYLVIGIALILTTIAAHAAYRGLLYEFPFTYKFIK